MVYYEEYCKKTLKEKIEYWDTIFLNEIENCNERELLELLKNIILSKEEKIFCKIRALQEMINLTLIEKIKERKTISFLLDDWENIEDNMLECFRLKYLSLFYIKEKDEIKKIIGEKIYDKNDVVKAEASYQLALIMLFDSNDLFDKRDYIKSMTEAQQLFETVIMTEENRVDAELLSLVCGYIKSSLISNMNEAILLYEKVNSLLREIMLLQLDNESNPIYINIGRNITKMHLLLKRNPDEWIDYKNEFNKLCADFYELANLSYKNNDFYNNLIYRLQGKLRQEVVEPVFKYNYKATLSKIDVILSRKDINETNIQFLTYLKGIIGSEDIKSIDIDYETCKQNFPTLTEEDIEITKRSIAQSNVSGAINHLLEAIERCSPDRLLRDLIWACIKLQANFHYKNVTEDERNDFIRDLLVARGYFVNDQTRQGTSKEGKASGEVDILIQEKNIPYAIVEALNLSSLNSNYLDSHIDKIYKYDTLGYDCNFIVSYVSIKDFNEFWNKYKAYIQEHNYPYELCEYDESINDEFHFSEIKVALTKHNRNGKTTLLYHICVRMQE
ncbi:hypothetical protein F9651_15265 [Listeria monocytogenes]|uniref:Uncharacterized protein n=1 Tax=Listeria monocytogenes TaxID=1639 RepID=A0A5M2PV37_LISMN|nr:hypothetical protein [Listeria monocytogenes]